MTLITRIETYYYTEMFTLPPPPILNEISKERSMGHDHLSTIVQFWRSKLLTTLVDNSSFTITSSMRYLPRLGTVFTITLTICFIAVEKIMFAILAASLGFPIYKKKMNVFHHRSWISLPVNILYYTKYLFWF